MTIKRDLSSLPYIEPSEPAPSGVDLHPTREPKLGPLIAQAWFNARTHDDHLAHAIPNAGWYRGSYAGTCSLALHYKTTGVPESDPNSIADHWRMDIGSMVHSDLQAAISQAMPSAEHEVTVDLNLIGVPGSMRIDTVNFMGDVTCETVEIKTINGFGYKSAATKFRGQGPSGPRDSAVIQGALGAVGYQAANPELDVTGSRIVYLALECLSPDLAKYIGLGGEEARFTAEWFISYDECVRIVEDEKDRISKLLADQADEATILPRALIPIDVLLPTHHTIEVLNPAKGTAVTLDGKGTKTWQCSYCNHQSYCIEAVGQATLGAAS